MQLSCIFDIAVGRCQFHYKGFYSSIDELWKVKAEFESLKSQVQKLNREVQVDGTQLLDQEEELAKKTKILTNIDKTAKIVETIKVCLKLVQRCEHVPNVPCSMPEAVREVIKVVTDEHRD